MSFTDVIGRVSQIESAIAQVSGAHRGAGAASAATRSAAASGALASSVTDSSGSGRSEFSDVMRSLTGAGGSGGSGGSIGSGGAGGAAGAGAASGTSGSSRGSAAGASGSAATSDAAAPSTQSRSSAPESRSGGVDGGDVLAQAKKYLGIPYVWGGTNPRVGLDCSGLVQLVFKDLGIKVPRVTYDQLKVGTEIPRLADAKPGDLIVTRNGDHIGIYAGDNKILHAPRPGKNVEIREMFEKDADILTIRRVVDAPSSGAARADGEVAAAQRSQFEASQRSGSRSGGSS